MHLTRYTASRVSLFHTFPLTPSLILGGCIRSITHDDTHKNPIGAPLSVYSILFTYYDPGDTGFDRVFSCGRTDILMTYMRCGKPLHIKYLEYAYYYGYIDVFDYALKTGLWIGNLDQVFATACRIGYLDAVKKLLPHIVNRDRGLIHACENSHVSIVTLLLSRDTYSNVTLTDCIRVTHNQYIKQMLRRQKLHNTNKRPYT